MLIRQLRFPLRLHPAICSPRLCLGKVQGNLEHMSRGKSVRIGLLFAQFSAYHIDRCQAVAHRFAGRAEVLAVEVATSSTTYAWEASGEVLGARKITLFPGEKYDQIGRLRRFWRQFIALRRCNTVMIGIGYNESDVIALSWLLALLGTQVILLSESKFDDKPRRVLTECIKAVVLAPYSAAIVGGHRHIAYFCFLGFRRRPVLPGYDTVSLERVRAMGGSALAPNGVDFADRNFIFVGRFVDKKNLLELIEGFALYAKGAGRKARRLVLIGAGDEEPAMRSIAAAQGVSELIDFPGFLSADAVARQLNDGLALVLASSEEQWGLVVNEALAFGLPAIISDAVGSGDLLVRNLLNGYVIEHGSPHGLAQAMTSLAGDEALWRTMVSASHARAWLGDTERLADAAAALIYPSPATTDKVTEMQRFLACPALPRSA